MIDHPLREYRLSKGLTLDALAVRIGTTRATIQRIEAGTRLPSMDLLRRITAETGLSADGFLQIREEAHG